MTVAARCLRELAKILTLLVLLTLVGCGRPVGADCQVTGSGFTASDPCQTQCLSRSRVFCPDDNMINPAVCAGRATCEPGDCPQGQFCYHFDDPFNEVAYCLPENVCGAAPDAAGLQRWEAASVARAAAKRAQFDRGPRGDPSGFATQPAEPVQSE